MSMPDGDNCLHCKICDVIDKHLDAKNSLDITEVFANLADVIGDLIANSEDMYSQREEIITNLVARIMERADKFIHEDRTRAIN